MRALAPIGRLLFSAIFISSGLNHLIQFEALTGYARSAGVPAPGLGVLLSGLMLLVGGLCVLLGAFARLGAALIAVFLLLAALLVHDFWTFADAQAAQIQWVHFMKNISLAGGALLITYFGPGPFSLRRRRRTEAERPIFAEPLRPRAQE